MNVDNVYQEDLLLRLNISELKSISTMDILVKHEDRIMDLTHCDRVSCSLNYVLEANKEYTLKFKLVEFVNSQVPCEMSG